MHHPDHLGGHPRPEPGAALSQHVQSQNRHNTAHLLCEVVMVVAGAAGLSAVVALARSLCPAVVIDDGDPRHAVPADARRPPTRERPNCSDERTRSVGLVPQSGLGT